MNYFKYIVTFLLVIIVLGCKSNTSETNPLFENTWENTIELEGKLKWEANKETTQGVNNMLAILENMQIGDKANFQEVGNKLENEINTIIKKCSMKGAAHDNLHIFLMPLIEKVDVLKDPNDNQDKKALIESIFYHLKAYDKYFK